MRFLIDTNIFLEYILRRSRVRVVREHLRRLEQPWSAQGDIKRLHGPEGVIRYRMHIPWKFTVFFRLYDEEDCVRVDAIMTMEQAHKKYGKYLDTT